MKKTALTKSESEVMYLLWHTDRALSAAEMVALSPQKTWKDSYIHLMVNSLLKKGMITPAGFVKTFRNYARTFAPCMTEEEYARSMPSYSCATRRFRIPRSWRRSSLQ